MIEPIQLWSNTPPYYNASYQNPENAGTPSITPYLIQDTKKHPAILICPGGSFTKRVDYEGKTIAEFFNQHGFHAFVLNYRVLPYTPLVSVADAMRAIRLLRYSKKQFSIDGDSIAMIGFSAGGSISAYTSEVFEQELYKKSDEIDELSARPDAVILSYAGLSFRKEHLSENDYETILSLVKKWDEDADPKAFIEHYSCDSMINPAMPPVFLWHTQEDARLSSLGAIHYVRRLKEQNVSCEFHLFPNGRHGIGIEEAQSIEGTCQWPTLCLDWLKRQGFSFE